MYVAQPGFVYVIEMSTANAIAQAPPPLIKVGRTGLDGLNDRRSALNTGNPYRLDYVAKWRVTDTIIGEAQAITSLANQNLRARPLYGGGREWFALPADGFPGARGLIQHALEVSQVLHPNTTQNM